jgi:hypothetical protein
MCFLSGFHQKLAVICRSKQHNTPMDVVCADCIDIGKLSYEAVLVSYKAPLGSHKRTFKKVEV